MPWNHRHHTKSSRSGQFLASGQAMCRPNVENRVLTSRDAKVVFLNANRPKPCLDHILVRRFIIPRYDSINIVHEAEHSGLACNMVALTTANSQSRGMLQLSFSLYQYLLDDIIYPKLFDVGAATVEDLRGVVETLGVFSVSSFFGAVLSQQTGLPGTVYRHGKLRVAAADLAA